MSFGHPFALWGLLLVPVLVIALALDGQRRRRALERIGHLPQIRRMTASVSVGRRRLKGVCMVLALALVVLSLARPQRLGSAHMLPRRGLDIAVALDFSRSMLAADVYPSRLERAKLELGKLIDGLKGDRVGLVAFAGVTLAYPLTSDYAAAKLFWRDLGPDDIPKGGTDLGEAIRASLDLFKYAERKSPVDHRKPAQVMILLTDGADTEGHALDAAREAAKAGVRIFPVGIGSRDGEVVVLKRNGDGTAEYVTDALGAPVRMQLDEATLKEIAHLTGGEYFQLDPERFGVERVQKAIEGFEREEERGRMVQEPEEACGWFLGAALALLALEALLRDRRRDKAARPAEAGAIVSSTAAPRRQARLGQRRRAAAGSEAALLLLLLVPFASGWGPWDSLSRFFQRLSPDVKEGNDRLAAGKAEDALAAYDRALAAHPDDPGLHYDRGAALYALGKYPEAEREFQRAAETPEPADSALRADALYNAGNALLKREQPKDAIDAYKRVLRLRPDDRRAKWNLELALRALEQEKQKQQQQQQQQQDQNKQQQSDQQKQQNDQQQQQQAQQDQKQQSDQQKQQNDQQQKQSDQQKDQQGQKQQDEQQKQQQAQKQQQDENKADQKDQQQEQAKQQQAKQDKAPGGGSATDENKPPEQKPGQQQQQQQQQQAQASPAPSGEGKPEDKPKPGQAEAIAGHATRDIDRQDAEAVLDAFERVEPTVQKDLARKKARNSRPRKDW